MHPSPCLPFTSSLTFFPPPCIPRIHPTCTHRRTHLVPTGPNIASPYPDSMTTRYGSFKPGGVSGINGVSAGRPAAGDLTAAQTSAAAALVGGSARLSPAGAFLIHNRLSPAGACLIHNRLSVPNMLCCWSLVSRQCVDRTACIWQTYSCTDVCCCSFGWRQRKTQPGRCV